MQVCEGDGNICTQGTCNAQGQCGPETLIDNTTLVASLDGCQNGYCQNGVFSPVTNTSLLCDDGDNNPCTTGICQFGVCQPGSFSNGASCSIGTALSSCQQALCQNGTCVSQTLLNGTQCLAADGLYSSSPCTQNTCLNGLCVTSPLANGSSPIYNTSFVSPCFFSQTCMNGLIVDHPLVDFAPADLDATNECAPMVCATGQPVQILKNSSYGCTPDENPCTNDYCVISSATSTCQHPLVTVGTPCDDGLACTSNDQCVATGCKGLLLTNFSNCGCNATSQCQSGLCVNPDYSTCDDGNPCTQDLCNATGCSAIPFPNGTSCASSTTPPCAASVCLNGVCTIQPLANGTLVSSYSLCNIREIGQCLGGSLYWSGATLYRPNGYLIPPQSGPTCSTSRTCLAGNEYRAGGNVALCPQTTDPCVKTSCNPMGCCTRAFVPSASCQQCPQAVPTEPTAFSFLTSPATILNRSGCLPFRQSNTKSPSFLFDIGFPFSFYGKNVSQFYVSPNGFIQFYDPLIPFVAEAHGPVLPNATLQADIVALLWTDLDATLWSDTCISTTLYYSVNNNTRYRQIDFMRLPIRGLGAHFVQSNLQSYSLSGSILLVESTGEIIFEYSSSFYIPESTCLFVTSGIQSATGHCQVGLFNGEGINGFSWNSYSGDAEGISSSTLTFQPVVPPVTECQYRITSVPFSPQLPTLSSDRVYSPQLNDDQLGPTIYTIGFPFQLYGRDMQTFRVCSNGYVLFYDEANPSFESIRSYTSAQGRPYSFFNENNLAPDSAFFSSHSGFFMIAFAAGDLYPPFGGSISTFMKGQAPNRIRVIEYDVPVYYGTCGLSVVSGQIILYESPQNWIEFQYDEISLPVYLKKPAYSDSPTNLDPVQRMAFQSGLISWIPSNQSLQFSYLPFRKENLWTASSEGWVFSPCNSPVPTTTTTTTTTTSTTTTPTTTSNPCSATTSLVSAQFSDDLLSIVVLFDGNVFTRGSLGCGLSFTTGSISLGSDCVLQIQGSTVYLSPVSTDVLPGMVLTLVSAGQLVDTQSIAICGAQTLQAPTNPVPLSIQILAPSSIAFCATSPPTTVVLALAGGDLSRPVTSTLSTPFGVSGPLTSSAGSTVLNTIAIDQSQLAGLTAFQITGQAVNALGLQTSVTASITIQAAKAPAVTFDPPIPVVDLQAPLTIFALIQPSSCASNTTVYSFTWQCSDPSLLDGLNPSANPLVLPVSTLAKTTHGTTLTLFFVVSWETSGQRATTSLSFPLTLTIPYDALVLTSASPVSQTVETTQTERIVVGAMHPDFPTAPASAFRYTWSCVAIAPANGACDAVATAIDNTFMLNADQLVVGASYQIKVVVAFDAGLGSAFVDQLFFYRTIAQPNFPVVRGSVVYSALGGYSVQLFSNLALNTASLKYVRLLNGGGQTDITAFLPSRSPDAGLSVSAVCTWASACLAVAGQLQPLLMISGASQADATATFQLLLALRPEALPPSSGQCACVLGGQTSITALSGVIGIRCQGWIANARISGVSLLTYTVTATPKTTGTGTPTRLLSSLVGTVNVSAIPAGVATSHYNVGIDVAIQNADGALVELPDVCVLPVLPPTVQDLNKELIQLEQLIQTGQSPSQGVSLVTSILTTANADGNLSRSLNCTILYDLFVFFINQSSSQTSTTIADVVNLFLTGCLNPDFFACLTTSQKTNLLQMYQAILAQVTSQGNHDASTSLNAALTSLDQCLPKLGAEGGTLSANGVLTTIQQSYINLSSSCEGPSFGQDGSTQSVLVISYFGTSLASNASYSSSNTSLGHFQFSAEVIDALQNRTCVFLVLTSLKLSLDSNRLPPQQMSLYDGLTGAEIPIDNNNPDSVHIFFQNPNQTECNTATCQYLDESASTDTHLVWSGKGCQIDPDLKIPNYTVCMCSHLTYFSALLAGNSGSSCNSWPWYQIATLTSVAVAITIILLAIISRELYLRFYRQKDLERLRSSKVRPTLPKSLLASQTSTLDSNIDQNS